MQGGKLSAGSHRPPTHREAPSEGPTFLASSSSCMDKMWVRLCTRTCSSSAVACRLSRSSCKRCQWDRERSGLSVPLLSGAPLQALWPPIPSHPCAVLAPHSHLYSFYEVLSLRLPHLAVGLRGHLFPYVPP